MTAPDAAKNGEGGHRGGRNAARPEALVVVRRHVTGNTWAVEADRPNLYIVLTRGQPPEEGDVHEAVQTQRGWMLGRRVEVRELPAELAHPEHPELVAEAGDLTGPDVIRVDSRVLVRENTEVAALVRTWRFRDLEAEAAYGAALIQGRNPYPGLRPLLRPQTLDIVREIAGRTAVTLTEAAVRYDDAQKAWRRGIDTARAEVGTLIQGARDELKELGDRKSELDRDVPDLLIREAALRRTVGELTGSETSLRAELAALDRQVREARERNRERERTDLDPRAALRGRGALVDERAALEHAYRLLGSRFETPLPLVLLHVALKHAPFTVLTGPSGAGKTSLVHQYARALGMHVTTVAVQPNWTSVQDLHGYVDPIAGRHYRGTPFSAALQAQVDYAALDDPEAPLDLVLLDEINLSFVEYFLSDYLSAFETEGREVRLATRDEAEKLAEEPFAWLRRTRGQVQVPRSFLIAGTANEDHTTRAFSDKFRDRSAFLYLPPPDVRRALREGGSRRRVTSTCPGGRGRPGGPERPTARSNAGPFRRLPSVWPRPACLSA